MKRLLAALALAFTLAACGTWLDPERELPVSQDQALAVAELTFQGVLDATQTLAQAGYLDRSDADVLRPIYIRINDVLGEAHRYNQLGDIRERDTQLALAQELFAQVAARLALARAEYRADLVAPPN